MSKAPLALAAALAALLALPGCSDYPRDADGLTGQAAQQGMRVGASHDPPWVRVVDGEVRGPEADLIRRYADAHGYRLTWLPGNHDALMGDLERARLHAVIGGHHPDSPWKPKVGWSRPLALRASADGPMPERRVALPPGQSAWHLGFDRYLVEREGAQ
ncbi:ABC transporter substrate-binding protein [Luteimonas sp. SDU101]|uniref:ABC transporter substrate-binding protein n=1 Tax=Luteimonas sp. SDU101 TaxID=3422593 RepID=UPI003EBF3FFE